MVKLPFPRTKPLPHVRHLRAPRPIHFPEDGEILEGKAHFIVRTFLWRILRFALCPRHSVGCGQFVYWNAREPRRNLAPDVFVKVDVADTSFGSWKTWERNGPPELAVEIECPGEGDGIAWEEKLGRYHELGVRELVLFEPEAPSGARLRVWDRLSEDLVERRVEDDRTPCVTLGLDWAVCPVDTEPVGLRPIHDAGRMLEAPEEVGMRREGMMTLAEAEAAAQRRRSASS